MQIEAALTTISPLDGRYYSHTEQLKSLASEYGLIRYRLIVEIRWLQMLANTNKLSDIPPLSESAYDFLNNLITNYDLQTASHIKSIEATTNHDVKAIEYYLKEQCVNHPELANISEFIHFACTSEDINNLSYNLMLNDIRTLVLLPLLSEIITSLRTMALTYANTPMLSRTHGQVATPTTVGKEIANVVARLTRQLEQFKHVPVLGKLNGAVGNFNAHHIAYPEVDWQALAKEFVESLSMQYNPLTTQIEPHDALAEYFHCLMRLNTILIDFSRDVWGYISLGYFKQKAVTTEIGSSTMPHKVNPIDFENAEGNLGLANAILHFFSEKLPISRWQRDLSDSTVLRNIGVAVGYMLIALKSLQKGMNKLDINQELIQRDLNENWEVLGEAVQTVMRRYHIAQPYEKLKNLTRDKKINGQILAEFIDSLEIPDAVKQQLKALTPEKYIGLANELVKNNL
jgi:adenylosuccinate lyase